MVGNDVIDLEDNETAPGALHPRFDERAFDEGERAALRRSAAPERLRWILWAAKEAAYKAARKADPTTVFSPPRFRVRLAGGHRALVSHGSRDFDVRFEVGDQYVHAVARGGRPGAGAPGSLVSAVERIEAETGEPGAAIDPGCSGGRVRALAIARIAVSLAVPRERLAIARDGRIPRLLCDGRDARVDLSLSHHGRFVAFACALQRFDEPAADATTSPGALA